MSDQEDWELLYEGPPRLVSALAQMLEEEGLTVRYTPPVERKGFGADAHTVVVAVIASGTTAALTAGVKAAVAKFRARFGAGTVRGRHEED